MCVLVLVRVCVLRFYFIWKLMHILWSFIANIIDSLLIISANVLTKYEQSDNPCSCGKYFDLLFSFCNFLRLIISIYYDINTWD